MRQREPRPGDWVEWVVLACAAAPVAYLLFRAGRLIWRAIGG